jgi:AcrR family transcriptional regulator
LGFRKFTMARTQAPDYEQRRADIVEKAAELYAARGFRGASVSDIARACAISKSLVYHYFPSTRDILFEVMNAHVEALLEACAAAKAAQGTPRQKLEGLLHAFLELYAGAAARQTVLLNEIDQLTEAGRAKIVGDQRRIVAEVQALIVEIRPDLPDDARGRVVTMLVFGMINWLHTWYDPSGAVRPPAVADLAAALILDGLERAHL